MKIKQTENCACNKPEIKGSFPEGCCSLNQIIKCHGDMPINELIKHFEIKKEE